MITLGWQDYSGYYGANAFLQYGYAPYCNFYNPKYTSYGYDNYSFIPIGNSYNYNHYELNFNPFKYSSLDGYNLTLSKYDKSFNFNHYYDFGKRYQQTFDYSNYAININKYSQYNLSNPITLSYSNKAQNNKKVSTAPIYYGPSDIPEGVTIDLAWWKAQGYDEEKGQELSLNAFNKPHKRQVGQCVGYTRETINEVYGTDFKPEDNGAAERFGYKILSSPRLKAKGGYFKCFRINGIKPSQVPDGAILIWPHTAYANKPNSKAALYGHGGIAHNGKVYSNCVCQNLSKCCEIWIPVTA